MEFKRTINASEIKRGMTIAIPINFLPFMERKLDHNGYHLDTVDGVVESEDNQLAIFGYDKIVRIPKSQFVYVISE